MAPSLQSSCLSLHVPVCVLGWHLDSSDTRMDLDREALWRRHGERSSGDTRFLTLIPTAVLSPPRLKPFTSYKFRVKATNDIGDSEFSEESESLTTLQAGQSLSLGAHSWAPGCSLQRERQACRHLWLPRQHPGGREGRLGQKKDLEQGPGSRVPSMLRPQR